MEKRRVEVMAAEHGDGEAAGGGRAKEPACGAQ